MVLIVTFNSFEDET